MGPTATGKSDLAVELALRLDGEIVNADASQLYRGMDIGTAKLGLAERREVPHHLLDVLDVTETASVATYQRDARAAVQAIIDRGRLAVLVGGSGLYVASVLSPLEFPGTDARVRARYEALAAELGPARLHAELAVRDPAAAAVIRVPDVRRVVRALEVGEITGKPFAATLPPTDPPWPTVQIGLREQTTTLDARITRRFEQMVAAGLVGEVERLVGLGLREGRTARTALGYAQLLRHLDGQIDLATAIAETASATCAFARRQLKWFRRDPTVRWLAAGANPVAEAVEVIGVAGEAP